MGQNIYKDSAIASTVHEHHGKNKLQRLPLSEQNLC